MKKNRMYRVRKTITLLLIFSVMALMSASFLPWVSVKNTGETKELFLNKEMVKNSDNPEVDMLYQSLNLFDIMLWCVVIFGLFSSVGLNIMLVKKYKPLGVSFLLIGCITVLFNSVAIFYHVFFIQNVSNMEDVSLAFIFKPLFISYTCIPLFFTVFSLYYSIKYTYLVAPYSVKYFSSLKESQKEKETVSDVKIKKKKEHWWMQRKRKKELKIDEKPVQMEKQVDAEVVKKEVTQQVSSQQSGVEVDKERLELEQWLSSEVGSLGEKTAEGDMEEKIDKGVKVKPSVESLSTGDEKQVSEGDENQRSTERDGIVEGEKVSTFVSDSSERSSAGKSFDEVLSSVVEKRQKINEERGEKTLSSKGEGFVKPPAVGVVSEEEELQGKIDEIKEKILKESTVESKSLSETSIVDEGVEKPEKPVEKTGDSSSIEGVSRVKKVKVRCPGCKHVFTAEVAVNGSGVFRVKCPNCGKEGVAK